MKGVDYKEIDHYRTTEAAPKKAKKLTPVKIIHKKKAAATKAADSAYWNSYEVSLAANQTAKPKKLPKLKSIPQPV